jgi:hypothetical protein
METANEYPVYETSGAYIPVDAIKNNFKKSLELSGFTA